MSNQALPSLTTPNTCLGRKSVLVAAPSTVEPINPASTTTGWNVRSNFLMKWNPERNPTVGRTFDAAPSVASGRNCTREPESHQGALGG